MVLTSPSTPRLSKYTDSLVSHWPGRISSDSLTALPYSSLRAATVRGRPAGAVTGTGRRPYIAHARPTAAITSTSATVPAVVNTAGSSGTKPTTGPRKSASRSLRTSKAPNPIAPIASSTIGEVITGGTSCGWTPSSHRRSPVKVMNITRVM
jgi:hypothetical protein